MKTLVRSSVAALATAALLSAAFPRLFSADPDACAPGDEVTVEGQNLGADTVAKLFLNAGGDDVEVEIVSQEAETLKFKAPADIEHGNYVLVVQTAGPSPALMEQPVRVEIGDAAEIAAKREEQRKLEEELAAPPEPEEPAEPAKD